MSNAMTGLATGAEDNKREQTVHTPDVILDVCRETFGGGVNLDPCASLAIPAFAVVNYYGIEPYASGLEMSWINGTYWNPPFNQLKLWMAHSAKQNIEQIGLFPVRTNRQWWCDYMRTQPDAIAYLKPVLFKGYEKGTINPKGLVRKSNEYFPAPLCLVYIGPDADRFEAAVRVRNIACTVTGSL